MSVRCMELNWVAGSAITVEVGEEPKLRRAPSPFHEQGCIILKKPRGLGLIVSAQILFTPHLTYEWYVP